MTVDELTEQAMKSLDEIIEDNLVRLEQTLVDHGATDEELADTLGWQHGVLLKERRIIRERVRCLIEAEVNRHQGALSSGLVH